MVETVKINGVKFNIEIDSGSAVTVISEVIYNMHFKDVPLSPTRKRLVACSDDRLICMGSLLLSGICKYHSLTTGICHAQRQPGATGTRFYLSV